MGTCCVWGNSSTKQYLSWRLIFTQLTKMTPGSLAREEEKKTENRDRKIDKQDRTEGKKKRLQWLFWFKANLNNNINKIAKININNNNNNNTWMFCWRGTRKRPDDEGGKLNQQKHLTGVGFSSIWDVLGVGFFRVSFQKFAFLITSASQGMLSKNSKSECIYHIYI